MTRPGSGRAGRPVRMPAPASRSSSKRGRSAARGSGRRRRRRASRLASRWPGLDATTRAGLSVPSPSNVSASANVPRSACQKSWRMQVRRSAARARSAAAGYLVVRPTPLHEVRGAQQRVVRVPLDRDRRVRPSEVEDVPVGVVIRVDRVFPDLVGDPVRCGAPHPEVAPPTGSSRRPTIQSSAASRLSSTGMAPQAVDDRRVEDRVAFVVAVRDQQVDPLGRAVDGAVVRKGPAGFERCPVRIVGRAVLVQDAARLLLGARVVADALEARELEHGRPSDGG